MAGMVASSPLFSAIANYPMLLRVKAVGRPRGGHLAVRQGIDSSRLNQIIASEQLMYNGRSPMSATRGRRPPLTSEAVVASLP